MGEGASSNGPWIEQVRVKPDKISSTGGQEDSVSERADLSVSRPVLTYGVGNRHRRFNDEEDCEETGGPMNTLHARIAKALGWTEAETQSFSFQSLRDLVRPVSPKLTAELDEAIQSGSYIVGKPLRARRRPNS